MAAGRIVSVPADPADRFGPRVEGRLIEPHVESFRRWRGFHTPPKVTGYFVEVDGQRRLYDVALVSFPDAVA